MNVQKASCDDIGGNWRQTKKRVPKKDEENYTLGTGEKKMSLKKARRAQGGNETVGKEKDSAVKQRKKVHILLRRPQPLSKNAKIPMQNWGNLDWKRNRFPRKE